MLLEKYVLKETLAKSNSGKKTVKITSKDVNIRKPADQVDTGSKERYKEKATYKKSKM